MYTVHARFNKLSRLLGQRGLTQLHTATFILPESLKSYATQKFHRYSLINSNGPFENPSSSCKYSKFLFQSVFLPAILRASLPLTLISILTSPREEGTIEVLLEMDFRTKKKTTSMFEEVCTSPEIESRNSRWAVVVNFGGASLEQSVIYAPSKSSRIMRTFQTTTGPLPF